MKLVQAVNTHLIKNPQFSLEPPKRGLFSPHSEGDTYLSPAYSLVILFAYHFKRYSILALVLLVNTAIASSEEQATEAVNATVKPVKQLNHFTITK